MTTSTIGEPQSPDRRPEPPNANSKLVFWHRELPPIDAEFIDDHTVEADSGHVGGSFAYQDESWDRCYHDLMAKTRIRLEQEIARLGGHYAHVVDESIESRHNDATNESWLHGRFNYALYQREPEGAA